MNDKKEADYQELGRLLTRLFLPEPGATALRWLKDRYDVAFVGENMYRESFNSGRRSVIKDIENLINETNQPKEH